MVPSVNEEYSSTVAFFPLMLGAPTPKTYEPDLTSTAPGVAICSENSMVKLMGPVTVIDSATGRVASNALKDFSVLAISLPSVSLTFSTTSL